MKGAFTATILAYVLPSLCTILVNYKQDRRIECKNLIPLIVCLIGILVVISGLISISHKIKNGLIDDCSHDQMSYCIRNFSQTLKKSSKNL